MVQLERDSIGKYRSPGLPLVASNSRLFLFLLQNRDEQLLPRLNLPGIRNVVTVHGPVNHDPYIFTIVVDFGADIPKRFIIINHNHLFDVFRLSHQRLYAGNNAKDKHRQDNNCRANSPPSVTISPSWSGH